jgi:translocation and assembly module TamA
VNANQFRRISCLWLAVLCSIDSARAQFELIGLSGELETSVLAALSLDDEPCDAPDWRITSLYQRTPGVIRNALESTGYYSSTIEPDLRFEPDCWAAEFSVDPGTPITLRNVDLRITGDREADPEFSRILNDSNLTPGSQLNHREYENLKTSLLEIAQRKGYAEAAFRESRIDVYPDEYAADLTVDFDPGPRYAFGDIVIRQQILNDALVEGFYDIRPGDPFDRDRLTEVYAALVDSGYFGLVNVRPLAADAELKQIPIELELTAGNTKVLSYGGGFATDTGPRVRIARTNRRLNMQGAQLHLSTELSPVVSEFIVSYRFPYGDPRTEWLSFDSGIKHEDTETSKSDSLEFGVRRITERANDWQETQSVDLLIEDFEIGDEIGRTTLLQPGISWFKVQADNTIRPDRGYRILLEVSAASKRLASDTDFLKTVFATRWIRSFENGGRILTRIRAGITWEDEFDKLPPSVRFFAGGDNSIRGYQFRSLGPIDMDGDVIGGNRLLVGSVEYEHPVKPRWSVATFYDVGNAFRDSDFHAVAGAGIGARWQSPLGPIRLDLAKPLDGPDSGMRYHISFGPDL